MIIMDDFKFSVIILGYNVESWIEKSVKSVIDQSLDFEKNIELILFNNGSTDNTSEICKKYADLYPDNVKYISKNEHGRNKLNENLRNLKGKYVFILHPEGYLLRNSKFIGRVGRKCL